MCSEAASALGSIRKMVGGSHGAPKAEHYSPDRTTAFGVVEAGSRKTTICVRESALHAAHYERPEDGTPANDAGALSRRWRRPHCYSLVWRKRQASGMVSQSSALSGSRGHRQGRVSPASRTGDLSGGEKMYLAAVGKQVP